MTLPHYSFLPWMRRGIGNKITETENFGTSGSGDADERASLNVNVIVKADNVAQSPISVNLEVIGPGDILGINASVIVKTEPHHWITNFEPNYFPYVDFYEEDFPWRYTPAQAHSSHKLRPWLVLVVLKEDEFTRNTELGNAPLNSIKLTESNSANWPLPKHDETWAWAHVHANSDIDPTNSANVNTAVSNLNTELGQNPDIAISRIICPRKLDANTSYCAFLIPAFETGRLVGLGADAASLATIKAQTPAWGVPASHAQFAGEFPIYFEWYFRTGATGDFEYLVRQLKPRELDNRVGRRPMDIQEPGYNLHYQGGTSPDEGTLRLEGALRIPGNECEAYPFPDASTPVPFRKQLADLVNLGEDMTLASFGTSGSYYASTSIAGSSVTDDPIVAPPIYGRWHALKRTVDTSNNSWLHELNLDPRNRVAAALGAEFVRKNQDKLMDQAWAQLGEVIEANKKIKWLQTAVESTLAMHQKHLGGQPAEQSLSMTNTVLARVKSGSATLQKKATDSILPDAAKSAVFRKLRRPNGPVMKRMDPNQVAFTQTVTNMSSGVLPGATSKQPLPSIANQVDTTLMNLMVGNTLAVNASGYNFKTASPGQNVVATNNVETIAFQNALQDFNTVFTAVNWVTAPAAPALNLNVVAGEVVDALLPTVSMPIRFYNTIVFTQNAQVVAPAIPDKIVPALAAPSLRQPLYKSLRDLGPDFFIPNLNLIPQNTISLLETNQKFIESYMVGANYEMGRELLWREYPTDQRGTYFKHFWENRDLVNTSNLNKKDFEDQVKDIGNIHEWLSTSVLGDHNARLAGGAESKLVLVIRGDLLKKFPNAVIYAVKAKWQLNTDTTPNKDAHRLMDPGTEIYPVFGAKTEPDITFIGFDLTAEEAIGDITVDDEPGYYFVIMERPGEPRFGLDLNGPGAPATWNDLAWDDVTVTSTGFVDVSSVVSAADSHIPDLSSASPGPAIPWGGNAANMAMILYQNPVMVAIHAHEMLPVVV